MDHSRILQDIGGMITEGRIADARKHILSEYPHQHIEYDARSMPVEEKLKIFIRDGFIDRYSGNKLLFPGVLRIITQELGEVFPFHKNWKMSDCHIAYWEMMPTYDHVLPIARGGKDTHENIVTTSQIMNSAKANFLLEEIGFALHAPGNIREWDGMISWHQEYVCKNPAILQNNYIRKWHNALIRLEKNQ
ncbi:MAG: hypothetical protein WCV67_06160 [Victivallaceae bacterium]|jgi:hypothetical protein